MNVKRIIVDKKDGCVACPFCIRVNDYMRDYYECRVTSREIFDCTGMKYREYIEKFEEIGTPEWCPLEVEEVCEWRLCYDTDNAMWDIAPDCCPGEYSMNKPAYEICHNCGRKIKYVEVE